MSIAANQQRTFLRLIAGLRPHWRHDQALPARVQALLARHREFGARDRRLYRELIYTTLRFLPWIEPWLDTQPEEATRRAAWLAADTPATRDFRAAFATGEAPAGDRAELLPAWFRPHCPAIFSGPELEAQLRRAPLWLRLQSGFPQRVLREFDERGWAWRRSEIAPDAIELLTEADITSSAAWREGCVGVQDLGSQLILESVGIAPGGRWLDACAGAGGKTLQLARLLGPAGHVDAHDVRPAALEALRRRAERAQIAVGPPLPHRGAKQPPEVPGAGHAASEIGFASIGLLKSEPAESYDGVLVDAPCSGSGTWRRAPHLKWTTTGAHIEQAAARQRALLHHFSSRVKPQGRLVYATCSLSSRENEEVVAVFLATHPEFRPERLTGPFGGAVRGAGLAILPARHDTDGFFVASLRRK